MKALGTGVRGVGWREIEILPDRRGKPLVYLHGRARKASRDAGYGPARGEHVPLRHLAFAFVVAPVQDETDYDDEKSLLIERLVRRGLPVKLVTSDQMRAIEAEAFASGVAQPGLMETAGRSCSRSGDASTSAASGRSA